jgi:hypothetical protein
LAKLILTSSLLISSSCARICTTARKSPALLSGLGLCQFPALAHGEKLGLPKIPAPRHLASS